MKEEFGATVEMLIPNGSDSIRLIDCHAILVVRCDDQLGELDMSSQRDDEHSEAE